MSKWHKILGIPAESNTEQVVAAYRKKAKECHPDVCKDPNASQRFKEVNTAYRVLTDPTFRPPKESPQPQSRPQPRPRPSPQRPKPKLDIWGNPIDSGGWKDSMEGQYSGQSIEPRRIFRFKPEPKEKEVDLWAKMPKDPMKEYWKEYTRLRKEMVYEDPELFWKKLDEWQRKNEKK